MCAWVLRTKSDRRRYCLSAIALLLAIGVSACAPGPRVRQIPAALLDRSYTVPRGTTLARLNGTLGFERTVRQPDHLHPVPMNLYWEYGFRDDWSWLWFVLPLGVKHSWSVENGGWNGALAYLHLGPPENFYLSPLLALEKQSRLTGEAAWKSSLLVQPVFRFKPAGFDAVASLSGGPVYEFRPGLALSLSASASVEQGNAGILGSQMDHVNALSSTNGASLAFSTGLEWSPSVRFDLELHYSLLALDTRQAWHRHHAFLELRYRW